MNAKTKYTTFETIIHTSLNLALIQNKLPLIHSGERNTVARYVINHNNNETPFNIALIISANFLTVSVSVVFASAAKVVSPNKNEIIKNKAI